MLNGAFEEAWIFSDQVLKERAGKTSSHLQRHHQWIWDGSPLEGQRVLIRCYHGLGDTIQFIRYMPMLKAIAKEIIVWAQAPLIPLLQTVDSIDRILPLHDGIPGVDYDVDVEIMELAHIFRTGITTIPNRIPYIHVQPEFLSASKNQLSVGLVWKAGDWDHRRNIPFQLLKPLFDITGNIYILQENAKAAGWSEEYGIHPGDVSLHQYASRIKGMDLIISIDSMPVHLAGALGVPVWTLLHADADWRWMRNRDDSPWYPTMKLFRQQKQDEWQAVIENVVNDLKQLQHRNIISDLASKK